MAQSMDRYSSLLHKHGTVEVWGNKWFYHPWYARNVQCPDGRKRTVYFNNDGDYYQVRCKYNNVWHKGFLSQVPNEETQFSVDIELEFIPYDVPLAKTQ
jgi:hypothetical protein